MQDVDEGVASALGIERNRGTLIRTVSPGGPAARAGIQAGDVIVSVAGQPVNPDQGLAYLLSQQRVGSRVPMEIIRGGQRRTVQVEVAQRPTDEELARQNGGEQPGGQGAQDDENKPPEERESAGQVSVRTSLGLTLRALTPEVLRQLQIRDTNVRGVVITAADPNSDAAQKGLRAGDIIVSVNQSPVTTPEAVAAAVEAARRGGRRAVLLQVQRGNAPPAYIGVDLVAPAR
jgi:serine protease Do